jgi:hypothetical protein
MTPRLTVLAAVAGLAFCATPALADGWGHDHWRWHEWHEWREHHPWAGPGYYRPWVYTPPPPVYYPPPPPAYYVPPPGITFGFSWP